MADADVRFKSLSNRVPIQVFVAGRGPRVVPLGHIRARQRQYGEANRMV